MELFGAVSDTAPRTTIKPVVQDALAYKTHLSFIYITGMGASEINKEKKKASKSGCQEKKSDECHCASEEFPCNKCSGSPSAQILMFTVLPGTNDFVAVKEDEQGRHLFAVKDIPAGTILWKEMPLVTAPFNEEALMGQSFIACSGCYSLRHSSQIKRCSNCNWPVCGSKCEKIQDHKINECQEKAPFSLESGVGAFSTYGYRIAILKARNPSKWTDIMQLDSYVNKDKDPMIQKLKRFQLAAEMHYLKIENVVSLDEYETIFDIMKLNSLGGSMYYENQQEKRLVWCLYKNAPLITSSCVPNCALQIKLPPSHELTVHAAVNIKEGEELTRFSRERIKGLEYLGGSAVRQRAMQIDGYNYFHCKCTLCADPTELGSNLSTLYCSKCKGYTILPINPQAQALGSLDDWKWECTTIGCSNNVTNDDLKQIHDKILELCKIVPTSAQEFKACANRWPQLKRNFQDKVHPNYWAIVAATSELCRQYCTGYTPPYESPDWKHHEEIMVYLLKIYDTIRPGLSIERARLHHSLGKAWFIELYGVTLKGLKASQIHGALAKMNEILEMERKALQYFKLDPESETLKEIRTFMAEVEETKGRLSMQMEMMRLSIG